MKKLLFIPVLLGALLATPTSAQRVFDMIESQDTLTNQTTKTYLTSMSGGPVILDVPYYYSIHVSADSISGANAGTAKLQVCNDRSGTIWTTVQTLTIDGSGTDEALWEGIAYGRRMRVYFEMPSGTRVVYCKLQGIFKRIN